MTIEDLGVQFEPPCFDLEEIEQVLAQEFGLSGELRSLAGERDQNIRVKSGDGRLYVLKISGVEQDEERIDFEARILDHIAGTAPGLGVQTGFRGKNGQLYVKRRFSNGASHLVRLVSYLPGQTFFGEKPSLGTPLFEMGRLQGQVCAALSSFFHPAARSDMPWDSSSDRLAKGLDASLLRTYESAKRVRGLTVAAVRKGSCGSCYRQLPMPTCTT